MNERKPKKRQKKDKSKKRTEKWQAGKLRERGRGSGKDNRYNAKNKSEKQAF